MLITHNKKGNIALCNERSPKLLNMLYDSAKKAIDSASAIIQGKTCIPQIELESAKHHLKHMKIIMSDFPGFKKDIENYLKVKKNNEAKPLKEKVHYYVNVKLNADEKKEIKEFCSKNKLTISSFLKDAIKKAINEETNNR